MERTLGYDCVKAMNMIAQVSALIVLFCGPLAVFTLVPRCHDFYEAMLIGGLTGALAAIVLCGAAMAMRGKLTLRWNAPCTWAAAFIAFAFISAIFAKNTTLAMRACAQLAVFFVCFYFLFIVFSENRAHERVLWIAAIAAALFAAHGIGQFLGFFPHGLFVGHNGYDPLRPPRHDFLNGFSVNSVFGNRNLLGDYIALALPVACGLWLRARGAAGRSLLMVMVAAIVFCLGLSGSRGAILGAGCGVAALAGGIMIARRRGRIVIAVFMLVVACAVVVSVARIGAENFKKDSVRLRRITMGATLEMVRDNPIAGVGLDRYRQEHLAYQAKYFEKPAHRRFAYLVNLEKQRHAHNEYLQIAAEMGLPGFIIFSCLMIACGTALWRGVRSAAHDDPMPALLFGAFISFCVICILGFPLRIPITMSLIVVLAAAGAACMHDGKMISGCERTEIFGKFLSPKRIRWEAVAALTAVCCAVWLDLALDPYRSAEYFRTGFANIRSDNLVTASLSCTKAYYRDPDNGNASYCLGIASLRMRHPEDAIYRLQRALKSIDDPELRFQLARAYRAKNMSSDAIRQLREIEAMTPAYVKPRMELASIYDGQGKGNLAAAEYRSVIRILINEHERRGNNSDRSRLISDLYYRTGDMKNYERWKKLSGI